MDSEVLDNLSYYTTEIVTAIVLGVVFFLLLRRYLAARRAQKWTEAPPAPVTFTPSATSARTGEKPSSNKENATSGEPHEIATLSAPVSVEAVPEAPLVRPPTAPLTPVPLPAAATAMTVSRTAPLEKPSNVANFGAYRIEQEVNKLVVGQAHRVEVLSSRAFDDRRAIEASLVRVLQQVDKDDDRRDRVRRALEDYGFVARRCAELLLAAEAHDRAGAARLLGEVGSTTALPFLLEALYDDNEAVRVQAVTSLGDIGSPSAIGALLDLARRHPEIPQTLLSNALNACSVDSLSFFDVPMEIGEAPLLLAGDDDLFGDDALFGDDFVFDEPEGPDTINGLPPGDDDEDTIRILHNLEGADTERRAELYRTLGNFRTRLSVLTLSTVAIQNPEPALRAAAVSGLCDIDHPSGFAPILLAVGDESREVRAAAARSLSRLSFERSEAYVHLAQHETPENLVAIAQACVKAGMATQALDRLVSEDPRQAYESFALLSLLGKAGEVGPLLDAVAQHRSKEVRLNALRLLAEAGQPQVADYLRQLAVREGISEDMRNALLEAIFKIEDAGRRSRENTLSDDNRASRVA